MGAAYRWRRHELIDFTGAKPSPGFMLCSRLTAGGVTVSRGRLAANDGVEIGAAQLVVAVVESDAFEMEWRPVGGDNSRRLWLLPNSAQIVPAGAPCHSRWRARPTLLTIAFEPALIEKQLREIGVREKGAIRARFGVRDPEIDSIVAKLRLELQFGGWSGRPYLESLGVVLAVHLLRNYASARSSRTTDGGLGSRRLRRVVDFIDAHLGEELTQADLARVAELSPHHFASAFRTSTGVAPHRYLTERRIARACELLARSEATVTTVAHALGFASHGHFSETFRRFVGVTPSEYKTASR
ncbi:helix-turn-helix domain-containing protein [Hyphococcus sp.]|jgi:AraC family transcriptional regulator|uniref:helix-turn-helix domain-containing protein n=1 Tax=Hyphococcus sp. TaxID=2038636 RepID=UPI003D11E710